MRLEHDLDELGSPIGKPVPEQPTPAFPDRSRTLHGAYARLEPLAPRHAHDLWGAFSEDREGHMWTYLHAGPFADEVEFTHWLTQLGALDQLFLYAIIDQATGTALGFASYLRVDPGARSLEVGWLTFSPRLQRNRVGTDAMFVMMREAFALGYRRYEWKCNALNAPSIAAAHRYGFTFEGLFRQALVVKGRNRDTAWFAVIDRDWPMLEAAFEQWLSADNFDADGQQRLRLSDLTAPCVETRWPTFSVTV